MSVEEDSRGRRKWKPPTKTPDQSPSGRSTQNKEKVRKKTLAKSSREWVDRQLRDPYVRRAQEAGYRARAAFKLKVDLEIVGNVVAKMVLQPLCVAAIVLIVGVTGPLAHEAILI